MVLCCCQRCHESSTASTLLAFATTTVLEFSLFNVRMELKAAVYARCRTKVCCSVKTWYSRSYTTYTCLLRMQQTSGDLFGALQAILGDVEDDVGQDPVLGGIDDMPLLNMQSTATTNTPAAADAPAAASAGARHGCPAGSNANTFHREQQLMQQADPQYASGQIIQVNCIQQGLQQIEQQHPALHFPVVAASDPKLQQLFGAEVDAFEDVHRNLELELLCHPDWPKAMHLMHEQLKVRFCSLSMLSAYTTQIPQALFVR